MASSRVRARRGSTKFVLESPCAFLDVGDAATLLDRFGTGELECLFQLIRTPSLLVRIGLRAGDRLPKVVRRRRRPDEPLLEVGRSTIGLRRALGRACELLSQRGL